MYILTHYNYESRIPQLTNLAVSEDKSKLVEFMKAHVQPRFDADGEVPFDWQPDNGIYHLDPCGEEGYSIEKIKPL